MNLQDDALKARVLRWETPPLDPGRMDAALQEALAALTAPRQSAFVPLRSFHPTVRAITRYAAVAMIGIALIWWLMPRQARILAPHEASTVAPEISLETLREINQLFPGQIDAIIAGPNGLDLRLSNSGIPGATDQPVRVTLASDHERRTIITYSGRSVNIDFAGASRCITPLINGDGAVIVLTPDRVFSPAIVTSGEGFRVVATTLANR